MKKNYLFFALYSFIMLFLTGCGSSGGGDDPTPSSSFSVDKTSFYIMGASSATFKITSNENWKINVPAAATWLTVSPTSGTGNTTVTCTASSILYRERRKAALAIISTTSGGKVVTVTDSLPNTAPAATASASYPTDGQTDVGDSFLHVQWNASVDQEGDKLYYNLDYSTDGTTWKTAATKLEVPYFAAASVALLPNTKYYWRVTTYDMFGQKSPVSKSFTFTTAASAAAWKDGEARIYQSCCNASATDPFTLILTGDGFTAADFVAGGTWDKVSTQAIMAFTNVEPYKTWGKYLRIVRLAAYSAESGTTAHESSGTYTVKNTKYGSMYDNYSTSAYAGLYNASTSEAGGTSDKVFNYALAQLKSAGINATKNYTVCILENVAHYSGTVQYYIGAKRTLGCVCLSPGSFGTQTGFENVMVHEIGGHAIGHLADLYTTVSGTIPADRIDGTKEMQAIGWYQNVSVYNDQGLCPWSSFFKSAEYSTYYPNVNLYEGARSYTKGIWRPESSPTCMNDNRFYYDAPSRYAIVSSLKECAGETLTWKDFVSYDYDRSNSDFSYSRSFVRQPNVPLLPEPIIHP